MFDIEILYMDREKQEITKKGCKLAFAQLLYPSTRRYSLSKTVYDDVGSNPTIDTKPVGFSFLFILVFIYVVVA